MFSRLSRRRAILNELREVDRLSPREVILADKIIELEDALLELQNSYSELVIRLKSLKSDYRESNSVDLPAYLPPFDCPF